MIMTIIARKRMEKNTRFETLVVFGGYVGVYKQVFYVHGSAEGCVKRWKKRKT